MRTPPPVTTPPPEAADRFVHAAGGLAAEARAAASAASAAGSNGGRAAAHRKLPRSAVVRGSGKPDQRVLRRMTVYLPMDLAKRLAVYCASEDLEMSAVIADSVERELKRRSG
jgi:hypothetical protein